MKDLWQVFSLEPSLLLCNINSMYCALVCRLIVRFPCALAVQWSACACREEADKIPAIIALFPSCRYIVIVIILIISPTTTTCLPYFFIQKHVCFWVLVDLILLNLFIDLYYFFELCFVSMPWPAIISLLTSCPLTSAVYCLTSTVLQLHFAIPSVFSCVPRPKKYGCSVYLLNSFWVILIHFIIYLIVVVWYFFLSALLAEIETQIGPCLTYNQALGSVLKTPIILLFNIQTSLCSAWSALLLHTCVTE